MTDKIQENVIYLDIETQHIMQEFKGGWKDYKNYEKLKIAELGILQNDKYTIFEEENINDLIPKITEADLIVGHNIIQFDYTVMKYYFDKEIMNKIIPKTFDTMLKLTKFTGDAGWCSLDDLACRNFGLNKTEDSIKIPEMWRSGEKDKIKEYLKNDLLMTKKVYEHGKQGGFFKYDHKYYGKSQGEKIVWVKW